jgi:hypothetical protein
MPRGAREAGCLLNVRVAADVVSRIGVPMGHTVVLETPASCRSPTSTAERVLSVVSPVAGLVVEGARGATVTVRAHLMTAVIEALGSRRSLADQDAHAYTSRLGPAPGWSVGDFF